MPPPPSASPHTSHSATTTMLSPAQQPQPTALAAVAAAGGGADGYAGTPRSPGSLGLLSEEELTDLFKWVDGFPLSRPKRNFTRDFSDACLAAEIIHQLNPRLAELHNYPPANSTSQKIYNWNTLSFKVLRKLGCALTDDTIQQIVQCKPGIVETVLFDIRQKLLHMLATNPPPAAKQRAGGGQGTAMSHATSLAHDSLLYPGQGSGTAPMLKRGKGSQSHASLSLPSPSPLQPAQAGAAGLAGPGSSVVVDPFAGSGYQQLQQQQQPSLSASEQEKDQLISTLKETVAILQEKIHKLELLLVLKDRKIQELSQ